MKVLNQAFGRDWAAYHGDSCEVIQAFPDDSIHCHIFSPPFASLYTYNNSERDMGNSSDSEEFFEHFKFLTKELYRTLIPGRIMVVHCMNLPKTITNHGYLGLEDFRGDLVRHFRNDGFIFHSEVTLWKDPVMQMQRTKNIGLLHAQIKKDSCISRQGLPDYLLMFRKPGKNPEPVGGLFTEYYGNDYSIADKQNSILEEHNRRLAEYKEIKANWKKWNNAQKIEYLTYYELPADWEPVKPELDRKEESTSIEVWQRYASPVWDDIDWQDTLNGQRGLKRAKDENDRKHICPLALDVIRRALQLWTNPGDIVYSPFGGIGSEGYVAVELGRKAILSELKHSYFGELVKNMKAIAGDEVYQPSLLDGLYSREPALSA